jgi:hypothetical protein
MANRRRDGLFLLYGMAIAAAFLLICSKSSPLYPLNDWSDTNIFFSCGKGMLKGLVIYRDLYDHKGPLLYALYALCALIDSTSFLGVFLLEVLAVGLFLWSIYKLLSLYGVKGSAWILPPVAGAVILSSASFQQGGSAEELCLPVLAWSLYAVLRWRRARAPVRMGAKQLIFHGILCGGVLWIKFTMLGFYAVWIGGLFFYHLFRREIRAAFACIGWFLLGVAIATAPWVIYFGLNGAIGAWLKAYLYDNIFVYTTRETLSFVQQIKAVLKSIWTWFWENAAYTAPMLLGAVWFTISRRISGAEKRWVWSLFILTALGVFVGGQSYEYYGLILGAFAGCALALPGVRTDKLLNGRRILTAAAAAVFAACSAVFCLAVSANTPDLLKPREQTMQYKFAAVVSEYPDATMLNYDFMDAGFYAASNITPSVKYFHRTNVPIQEMLDEQRRYIREGVTDFVVSRDPLPAELAARYTLVATSDTPDGFWYDAVYLYERNDPLTHD